MLAGTSLPLAAGGTGVRPRISHFSVSPTALPPTGGVVAVVTSVTNARSCTFVVTPTLPRATKRVACTSGTYRYSFSVPANNSQVQIVYTVHLAVRGLNGSTVAVPQKIAAATESASTTTTLTSTSSTTTTLPVATTTYPKTTGRTVPVSAEPDAFVIDGTNIWVASCSGNAVTEINNSSKQTIEVITGPSYGFNCPDALAFDGTNIWVANKLGSSITELNASTGSWVQTLSGTDILNPDALAFDGTNIWISDDSQNGQVGSFISEFNASTGMVDRTINTPKNYKWIFVSPTCLALDGSGIWIADLGNTNAIEFNVDTGAYIRKTTGGPAVSGVACVTYHSGYIWLSSINSAAAIEYNANTGVYVRTISNILNPNQLIFTGSYLFIVSENPVDSVREYNSAGTLLKTVAKSNKSLGKGINTILVDGASLWTANYSSNSVSFYSIKR